MTTAKEDYLKLKKDNLYSLEFLYEMYLEKKSPDKPTLSFEQFRDPMIIHISLVGIDTERYFEFFDKKFEVGN
jgi:hypothetical protein